MRRGAASWPLPTGARALCAQAAGEVFNARRLETGAASH